MNDAVQYEILGEITPEAFAEFDADQNISDFKEINNNISRVYGPMDLSFWLYSGPGVRMGVAGTPYSVDCKGLLWMPPSLFAQAKKRVRSAHPQPQQRAFGQ